MFLLYRNYLGGDDEVVAVVAVVVVKCPVSLKKSSGCVTSSKKQIKTGDKKKHNNKVSNRGRFKIGLSKQDQKLVWRNTKQGGK